MMYQTLAHFYDALVQDEEATQAWVEFIKQHSQGNEILEVACGSGEITIALAKQGFHMDASDLSNDMLEVAKQKQGAHAIHWFQQDMRYLTSDKQYDTILCLCDSFNYILEEQEVQDMFNKIHDTLKVHGTYIMDMHSLDRLSEFEEEFFEDGQIDGKGYQWTINRVDDCIYQNFAFYESDGSCILEQHVQRVYDPNRIKDMLETSGFHVSIYTDFTISGIAPGEKYFYVCKKKEKQS